MGRSTVPKIPLPASATDRRDPLIHLGSIDGPLVPTTLFTHAGPVEVEVGFGKGRLLLDLATASPTTNFLGIERALPYARLVRYHALMRDLDNVRLLAVDAADVFHRLLPDRSVDAVHILFPDPWPKRRHHKRRLIQSPFIIDICRVLVDGGSLSIATDHDDYWQHIAATVASLPSLQRCGDFRLGLERLAETHFGARFGARGVTFNAATWRRAA